MRAVVGVAVWAHPGDLADGTVKIDEENLVRDAFFAGESQASVCRHQARAPSDTSGTRGLGV